MLESSQPIGKAVAGGLRRRPLAVAAGIAQAVEPACFRTVDQETVEAPIDQVERISTVADGQRKWAKVAERSLASDVLFRLDREGTTYACDLVSNDGLQAPVAEEEVAAELLSESVFVIAESLGSGSADPTFDDREGLLGSVQEFIRVSIVAADDVMSQAVRPLLAVVVVTVREDLVGGRQGDLQWVSLPGRDDFQAGPVGTDADHAAA